MIAAVRLANVRIIHLNILATAIINKYTHYHTKSRTVHEGMHSYLYTYKVTAKERKIAREREREREVYITALIAQSDCRYSLRIPPRPRSLLLRSTQLDPKR